MPRWTLRALACMLALLLLPVCAFAQEAVELADIGVRFYLDDEPCVCITRDNVTDLSGALQAMGLTATTVRDLMQREDAYLLLFAEDGAQLILTVSPKPDGIQANDEADLTESERALFLRSVAAEGRYLDASWPERGNGFALLSHILPSGDSVALDAAAASTLYCGAVYTLRVDVIGRSVGAEDEQMLLSAAQRFLRLIAPQPLSLADGDELVLPAATLAESGEAEVIAVESALALTLDPVPATVPTTSVTLSGTTAPKAALRYVLGKDASTRFYADENGRFSVTVNDLVGDEVNELKLSATKDELTATVNVSILVDWQDTPVTLACTYATVEGDKYMLYGKTLPGAKVQMLRKSRSIDLNVADDGSFSCNVSLNTNGGTAFTIRALAVGYHRTDVSVSLNRAITDAAEVKQLEKNINDVRYKRLTESPEKYADRLVKVSGTVVALGRANGAPCYLLRNEAGEQYLIQCQSLAQVQMDAQTQAIATAAGVNATMESAWDAGVYPLLRESYRYPQSE